MELATRHRRAVRTSRLNCGRQTTLTPRPTPMDERPLIVSAKALSQLSLTLPTEGSMPASASHSVYLIEIYWLPRHGARDRGVPAPTGAMDL